VIVAPDLDREARPTDSGPTRPLALLLGDGGLALASRLLGEQTREPLVDGLDLGCVAVGAVARASRKARSAAA
jgi:hypothetical protein